MTVCTTKELLSCCYSWSVTMPVQDCNVAYLGASVSTFIAIVDRAVAQIVKYLRDATHELRYTTMVALLQPAPETYELFDDVLLLSDGACARRVCAAEGRVRGVFALHDLCCMDPRTRQAVMCKDWDWAVGIGEPHKGTLRTS